MWDLDDGDDQVNIHHTTEGYKKTIIYLLILLLIIFLFYYYRKRKIQQELDIEMNLTIQKAVSKYYSMKTDK